MWRSTPARTGCARCGCGWASWSRWWPPPAAPMKPWRGSRCAGHCAASTRGWWPASTPSFRPGPWPRCLSSRSPAVVPRVVIDALGRVKLYDGSDPRGTVVGQGGYLQSYEYQIAAFEAAVLDGVVPAVGAEYSLGELRGALAMYRSAAVRPVGGGVVAADLRLLGRPSPRHGRLQRHRPRCRHRLSGRRRPRSRSPAPVTRPTTTTTT